MLLLETYILIDYYSYILEKLVLSLIYWFNYIEFYLLFVLLPEFGLFYYYYKLDKFIELLI